MSQQPTKAQKKTSKKLEDKISKSLLGIKSGLSSKIAKPEPYKKMIIPDLLSDIIDKNEAIKSLPSKKILPVPSIKELTAKIFASNGTFVHVKSKLGRTKKTRMT